MGYVPPDLGFIHIKTHSSSHCETSTRINNLFIVRSSIFGRMA